MAFTSQTSRIILMCALALTAAACSPTVKIEAPDKPIVLKLDVNIKQEVLLKVEKDIEGVSVTPAIPMAKRAGWIGERPDGYLGFVRDDTPSDIASLVDKANDERIAQYIAIAQKHDTTRETIEAVAGMKFIERSAPGEFIMTADGKWVRKQ